MTDQKESGIASVRFHMDGFDPEQDASLADVVELLRSERPALTSDELERVNRRLNRSRAPRRGPRPGSRLAVGICLAFGLLFMTAGTGLAISGFQGQPTTPSTPIAAPPLAPPAVTRVLQASARSSRPVKPRPPRSRSAKRKRITISRSPASTLYQFSWPGSRSSSPEPGSTVAPAGAEDRSRRPLDPRWTLAIATAWPQA